MVVRYTFGLVLGLITTFLLFMIMQSVISNDRNPFTDGFDGKIVDIVRLDEDQEIEIKKRKPPKPPPPDEPPPDMPTPDFDNSAISQGVDIGAVNVDINRKHAASRAMCCSSSSSPQPVRSRIRQ